MILKPTEKRKKKIERWFEVCAIFYKYLFVDVSGYELLLVAIGGYWLLVASSY